MRCLAPFFYVAAAVLSGSAVAQDVAWQRLSGDEIRTELTGHSFQYDTATQTFFASGRTLYNAGQDSWGNWQVQGDRYCSQWPPRREWVCYDIEAAPGQIRFVGEGDDITLGVRRP